MRISPRDLAPNMSYSLAAAAAAIGLNSTQNPDHQKGRDFRRAGRTTITVHPRPMSSAPLDGTPVRLFAPVRSAIASFWSAHDQSAFAVARSWRRVLKGAESVSLCVLAIARGSSMGMLSRMGEIVMQLSDPKPTYRSECLRCGETLFLPERSEHLDRQRIQRLWKCESCDYAFETRIAFPLHRSARTSDAD